ncbi:flagellar basal-body rod protein FlgG [Hirschia baltica]|uniref:Flagellar basal-body rod protein FlgG n=1 Tax=Hirschia baltica (strain ATCC 49814 / DSM 5838 / IFAM 1418) TaxID=582402 RepID=C6XN61_HIRBI|nr:flagellar basal-body rod protein FlgG [Hirschia baltica]ACT58231.1 flagellar basal-body rod protein FlgG [Hirschia baltica ATCC 49814]
MRALSTAATGMQAQQLNVEVISNNIANMNTTGYKRQRAEFQDLLYTNMEKMGVSSSDANTIVPTGVQIGTGVKAGSVYRITEQGPVQQTSNSYDVAMQGDGYFIVQLPDGRDAYTRAGNFSVNGDGQIVTEDGYTVSPGINVPEDTLSVTINAQGTVTATTAGATDPTDLGALELARFVNPAGLDAIGDNLLLETVASGAANVGQAGALGFGTILQGFLETSNVNAVTEISALINAQRAYEMNSKVITATDEMLQTTSQLK